jgi:hypothetical protein
MMKIISFVSISAAALIAGSAFAADNQQIAQRIWEDSRVFKRVAQVAGRDLPKDVLRKIASEDIDLMRGKRPDATYEYAHYERDEADRQSDRFAVRKGEGDKLSTAQLRAPWVYRLIVSVPNRRLVVTHNRRVYIDHIDLDLTAINGTRSSQTLPVQTWLEPGDEKRFELPEIERDAIAKVYSRVDSAERGAATIEVVLVNARLVDNSDSPFFTAVQTAKQLQRAIDRGELDSIRRSSDTLASNIEGTNQRIVTSLASNAAPAVAPAAPVTPSTSIDVSAPRTAAQSASGMQGTPTIEIYLELQSVEDMLTGTEADRREGLDKLHQLIRKLRAESAK